MKKTVVLGASPNAGRYSNMAVRRLKKHGFEAIPVGIKAGEIEGLTIKKPGEIFEGVDTVTLYLNADNQRPYYDYIFSLHPKRIIFNPGAENGELMKMAKEANIETMEACTLVMLSIGNY